MIAPVHIRRSGPTLPVSPREERVRFDAVPARVGYGTMRTTSPVPAKMLRFVTQTAPSGAARVRVGAWLAGAAPTLTRRGAGSLLKPSARSSSMQSGSECERSGTFLGRKQRGHSLGKVHERSNLVGARASAWRIIFRPDGGRNFVQQLPFFVGQAIGVKLAPPRQVFALQLGLILWRELPKAREPFIVVKAHKGIVRLVRNLRPDGLRAKHRAKNHQRSENRSHDDILSRQLDAPRVAPVV